MANRSLTPDTRVGAKVCRKCGTERELTLFPRDRRATDLSGARCRSCCNVDNAMWAANNPDKVKQMVGGWCSKNKARMAEVAKKWRDENAERKASTDRAWYAANKDRHLLLNKEWQAKNPEKVKAKAARFRERNRDLINANFSRKRKETPERVKEIRRAYRDRHPEITGVENAIRRAIKRNARVEWADKNAIRQIYRLAKAKETETGVPHHVDHIVPLKSKLVCGLHVEANLQVLTAFENISKHNKTWPDMP